FHRDHARGEGIGHPGRDDAAGAAEETFQARGHAFAHGNLHRVAAAPLQASTISPSTAATPSPSPPTMSGLISASPIPGRSMAARAEKAETACASASTSPAGWPR